MTPATSHLPIFQIAPALTLVGALFLAPACDSGGADDHDEPEHAAEEGCEHMAEAAGLSVTATSEAADAADGTVEHARAEITLIEVDGGHGGYVTFASEGGDHHFFLSADVPFQITDATGTEVVPEGSEAVDECEAVAIAYEVHLEVGLHHLWFGPTGETTVGMVFEAGEHDEEHE